MTSKWLKPLWCNYFWKQLTANICWLIPNSIIYIIDIWQGPQCTYVVIYDMWYMSFVNTDHKSCLEYCNSTNMITRYVDYLGMQMEIQDVIFSQALNTNFFTGISKTQFSGSNLAISGTLDGDCTGSINFPLLGGAHPFAYHRHNCSFVISTTGDALQSRETGCTGNTHFITNYSLSIRNFM